MHRVILNDDCTWYWDRFVEEGAERVPDAEIARRYVRQYKNSGMTDYFVNINGQYSFTPSRVMEICEDIYQKTDMGGIPVDFKSNSRFTAWHNHYIKGIDVYGEMIDECNKIGISPWISIRMNDIHCSRKNSPHGEGIRSMFLHTAHERGLMRDSHRDIVGYYDETLDYGKEGHYFFLPLKLTSFVMHHIYAHTKRKHLNCSASRESKQDLLIEHIQLFVNAEQR